jgi:hypothetical protein
MEMLAVLIVIGSFVALALAGSKFGVDSRDRFGDPGRCLGC